MLPENFSCRLLCKRARLMHLLAGQEVAKLDMPCGDSCMRHCSQGPGKRPAVFSHDKLVWELAEDALEAARLQNGVLP